MKAITGRKYIYYILGTLCILIISFILFISFNMAESPEKASGAYDIIRLHVIANSDSPEDQALKLKVRDAILDNFSEIFKSAGSIKASRNLIENNLDVIKSLAKGIIRKSGYNYSVDVKLGIYPFPAKMYGNKIYPPGDYEALRVVIGEGEGANWWCVMFPPLCFVDISDGGKSASPKQTESDAPIVSETDSAYESGPDSPSGSPEGTASDSPAEAEITDNDKKPYSESDEAVESPDQEKKQEVKYTFIVVKWWNALVRKIRQWF